MENIFSFDVFLINVPIYLAFVLAGYMLAIKPKMEKKSRAISLSEELYDTKEDLKIEKVEDFEIYLKLAKLFRKSGEFEKSVQIHKKLLENESLSKSLESRIILELGRDYLASGLFDKAEENLLMALKLTDKNSQGEKDCLLAISELYERQVDWIKAVVYRKKLIQIDDSYKNGLALLLCNLASKEYKNKNIGNAKKSYLEALDLDKDCVLAVKELATIFLIEKNYQEVFNILNSYVKQSTRLLNLMVFAFKELLENDEFKKDTAKLLESLTTEDSCACDYEVCILYCQYLLKESKTEELQEFISKYNETHKHNLQAIYTMALFLKDSKFDYKSKDHSNVLLEKIDSMLQGEYNYQCRSCGYHTKHEFWHCPQCQKWDTLGRISR